MGLSPATCVVFVYLQDILGNAMTSATFAVRGGAFRYGQTFVDETYSSSNFDSNGFAMLQVVESATPGVKYSFSITYQSNSSQRQINFDPVIIPNVGSINLCTIAGFNNGLS